MKTIAKLGLKLSLIIMIGLMTFTGCQKEIEKVKVNTSGNTKSLIGEYGEFGNATLGKFYVDHLNRIASLESFPNHSPEAQNQLIREYYHQYFPEENVNINSVDFGYLKDAMTSITSNYTDAKEYLGILCETNGFSEFTKDQLCSIIDIVVAHGPKLAKGAKLNDYLQNIRDLKKKTDAVNITSDERNLLVNSMTIAYYAGIYWYDVVFNEANPWHEPIGVSANASYASPNGFSAIVGLLQSEIIGSGGCIALPFPHPWPFPWPFPYPKPFPWPLPNPFPWPFPCPTPFPIPY